MLPALFVATNLIQEPPAEPPSKGAPPAEIEPPSIETLAEILVKNCLAISGPWKYVANTVSELSFVDLEKVGGALASLARKLTPLGMAAGTVAYICAETSICDVDGVRTTSGNPSLPGYPYIIVEAAYYCTGFGCTVNGNDLKSSTAASIACELFAAQSPYFDFSSASATQCNLMRTSNPKARTNQLNAVKTQYKIPEQSFELYYSASKHTKVERKKPALLYISIAVS
ncbi:hypothetical protein SAMN05216325_11522 [Nitrosomonas marina]|uniref:Uncharacterized protein n=2 Tax=Nitrosomonas marina TaxID=917 RepID=A0A1H8FWP4_9PROT|nr:hypothetical protein SAMN05216325_11522 [Nitrosomonas marina]